MCKICSLMFINTRITKTLKTLVIPGANIAQLGPGNTELTNFPNHKICPCNPVKSTV